MKKYYLVFIIGFFICTACVSYFIGVSFKQVSQGKEYILVDVPYPEYIVTEKIVTVNMTTETVREIPVEIEKIVNGKLKEFSGLGKMTDWVKEHLVVLWGSGWTPDCDDYACRLQREAYEDGYAISVQLIDNGIMDGKNVSNYTEFHMGNLAVIGDEIYFIEPQPEYFRIVYVCNKD